MLFPACTTDTLRLPDGAAMPYMQIGSGSIPLLVIPGAGDGMATATEARWRLAWCFRPRLQRYRILYLSRRQPIPEGYSVERHADDYLWALAQLGWGPGFVECNSAGGPVGQWLAVKRPELVRGLILSCTLHRANEHFRQVLRHWIELAQRQDWTALQWSSIAYTFRPQTVARMRFARPFLRLLPGPHEPQRVIRLFEELLNLDNSAILPQIACPALVIGGEDDRVIDAAIQREMAALIPHSRLILYPGYGHGNDQENPDYRAQLDRFINDARQ
jgi:pimeloyl-ACP methyl ester carboxylesterase